MVSFKRNSNRPSLSKKNHRSQFIKTKGQRLGWVSINKVEAVSLEKVLTNGKVIKLNQDNKPMLVP